MTILDIILETILIGVWILAIIKTIANSWEKVTIIKTLNSKDLKDFTTKLGKMIKEEKE